MKSIFSDYLIDPTKEKVIKDIITCGICLDYYKDPRLLPCSHTYCYECIRQLIKNNQFTCPLRDDTTINENDIGNLPINRTAKDMAEYLPSLFPDTTNMQCDNCSVNSYEYWCEQCQCYLCVTCSEVIHSQKVHRNHSTVAANLRHLPEFCVDHSDEKIKYWCTTCQHLVCRDCLLFKHKDHVYIGLSEIVQETRSKIELSLRPIRETLEKASAIIQCSREEQNRMYSAAATDIDKTYATLHSLLDERKMKLMQQLNECRETKTSILEKYHKDINEQLKTIKIREILVQQIFSSNNNIQIMKMRNTLLAYDQQINEQIQQLEQGCTFSTAKFDRGTNLEQQIDEYGIVKTEDMMINLNGVREKKIIVSLNLSIPTGTSSQFGYEGNRCRGYIFRVQHSLKIQSVKLEASIYGSVVVYIVNDSGVVIQKESAIVGDTTMKWTTIPIIAELNNNYSVLVWSPDTNGKFSYKEGDNQFRAVDTNCSIESKYAIIDGDLSVGEKMTIHRNSYSIQMIIDLEK
jgi:hypothetical protein